MEIISCPLAGTIAANSDGRFRLTEHHGVSAQFDIVDAEQDDRLAVVALVKSLLEFNPLG